jgi:acetylornithine aminotransferase
VAGVISEAIQGVGGINVATDDFLTAIRSLCDTHGALFIADEVQCGYGRTGAFYATDHSGVQADIYTMAKGMGNGFPVGGIAIAPHIEARHGMLGTTFGGSHLACAAALAVLEVMAADRLMDNAAQTGQYIMEELATIEGLQNIRGRGLMIGFDLPDSHKSLRKDLLQKHHIFTGEAKPNVVRLLPALNIRKEEANALLGAIRAEMEVYAS